MPFWNLRYHQGDDLMKRLILAALGYLAYRAWQEYKKDPAVPPVGTPAPRTSKARETNKGTGRT